MKKPFILGLEASIRDGAFLDTKTLFDRVGGNTGNLAFQHAIREHLGRAASTPWHLATTQAQDPHTMGVLQGANQLGVHVDQGNMAKRLQELPCRLIIIGLGAQSDVSGRIPKLPQGTVDWVREIADHRLTNYPNISVRGPFTLRVLEYYGLGNHATVLGCPSLFINPQQDLGKQIADRFNHRPIHRVAVASGHQSWKELSTIEAALVRLVTQTQGSYVGQHGLDMMRLTRGEASTMDESVLRACRDFACPDMELSTFVAWSERHGRLFFDVPSWMEHYRRFDFVTGVRIHGVMLALQAGVPALCIVHDSRLLELCQVMKLPYVLASEVPQDISLEQLTDIFRARFDAAAFDQNRHLLATQYLAFLRQNEIEPVDWLIRLATSIPKAASPVKKSAIQGFVESIQGNRISGWAFDGADEAAVRIVVEVNGVVWGTTVADRSRADIESKFNRRGGFMFEHPQVSQLSPQDCLQRLEVIAESQFGRQPLRKLRTLQEQLEHLTAAKIELTEKPLSHFPVVSSWGALLASSQDSLLMISGKTLPPPLPSWDFATQKLRPLLPAPCRSPLNDLPDGVDYALMLHNALLIPPGHGYTARKRVEGARWRRHQGHHLVLTANRELIADSAAFGVSLPDMLTYVESGVWSMGSVNAEHIEQPCFFLDIVSDHFGHALVEGFARLWPLLTEVRSLISEDWLFVGFGMHKCANSQVKLPNFLISMLATLGVKETQIRRIDHPIRCSQLLVPERLAAFVRGDSPFKPSERIAQIWRHIGDQLVPTSVETSFPQRLFLSRSRFEISQEGRCLPAAQAQQLDQLFADLGYTVVHPQELTLRQQIALVRAAQFVVGCLGSQLHLSGFATENHPHLLVVTPQFFPSPTDQLIAWVNRISVDYFVVQSQLESSVPIHLSPWSLSEADFARLPHAIREWENSKS